MALYIVGGLAVFFGSGVMAMAGLGAAFLFVPLFCYLGVPLGEATSTALLLNAVSPSTAAIAYARGGLIDRRIGTPVLITAVLLAPLGAALSPHIERSVLLALFVGFLVLAGAMMLFYRPRTNVRDRGRRAEAGVGAALGSVAGFLGGLLGVGGGNTVLPGLTWLGLPAKLAAGTTALVVVFASLPGFLGHMVLGTLDPVFLLTMAALAAARLARRLARHADPAHESPAQALHRHPAPGHRRKDGVRLDELISGWLTADRIRRSRSTSTGRSARHPGTRDTCQHHIVA